MKNLISPIIFGIFLFASCSQDESTSETSVVIEPIQKKALSAQQINDEIDKAISKNTIFNWNVTSSFLLWSAASQGNHVVSIGFGKSKNDFDRSKSPENAKMQQELLDLIMDLEGNSKAKTLVSSDPFLNTIDVIVQNHETIIALRKLDFIRYIEPANYKYFAVANNTLNTNGVTTNSSGSGCGFESEVLNSNDYTIITPNAKASWTLYKHFIPEAWHYSTGKGITIGIVDTGISPNQTLLSTNFNDGFSIGRTVQKYGTYVNSILPWSITTDGPNDHCGHGTSMASAAVAPRNDKGLPVGVAYNSNLITYRAASNVVLDGFHEQNGVKNALIALGNNTNVKIISMSMGHIIAIGKIEDGIRYAYSKGKLIFCAGGTSTSFTNFTGVIFPASMDEVVAVTGIKEGIVYQRCDDCHSGSKIDFTVTMQRFGTSNTVPVLSYYYNQSDYVGGSSVATATTAGIAALVWAKNPSWTRVQVFNKMKQSSQFYPYRNAEYGFGNVNALRAVQ